VNLCLRTELGQRKLAVAERSVDQELERLLKPVVSAFQIMELAVMLRALRCADLRPTQRP
jgi:hypothetical protein